jgi:hypothetical protein
MAYPYTKVCRIWPLAVNFRSVAPDPPRQKSANESGAKVEGQCHSLWPEPKCHPSGTLLCRRLHCVCKMVPRPSALLTRPSIQWSCLASWTGDALSTRK